MSANVRDLQVIPSAADSNFGIFAAHNISHPVSMFPVPVLREDKLDPESESKHFLSCRLPSIGPLFTGSGYSLLILYRKTKSLGGFLCLSSNRSLQPEQRFTILKIFTYVGGLLAIFLCSTSFGMILLSDFLWSSSLVFPSSSGVGV